MPLAVLLLLVKFYLLFLVTIPALLRRALERTVYVYILVYSLNYVLAGRLSGGACF
jgi:low temperature requirement protein LtrA